MARTAAAGSWSLGRAWARAIRHCAGRIVMARGRPDPGRPDASRRLPGRAGQGRGDVFRRPAAYARLVLKLAEDVPSEVTAAGTIIVIRFKRPVDIPVDKLSEAVPDYVASARRDPDGAAIRLSLVRKVTINTMTAGERVFVDLLPDGWSGPPPSLPQRGGPRTVRTRARRRARVAHAARGRGGEEACRRFASAPRCSRPSSASCLKCPTASASLRC